MYKRKNNGRKKIGILIALVLVLLLAGAVYYLLSHYKVKNVYVDGNVHYTGEEIQNLVMGR